MEDFEEEIEHRHTKGGLAMISTCQAFEEGFFGKKILTSMPRFSR